jgi:hypothetical protein
VGVKAREQTSALEKAQATENHRTTDLAATEDTHAEAPTSADAVASVQEGPVGEEYEAKGVSIQGQHIISTPQEEHF